MKLRIKSNTIRLRLSKSEVAQLAAEGHLQEQTTFANSTFTYAVQSDADTDTITADFTNGTLTVYMPQNLVQDWPVNDVVSLDNKNAASNLFILIEKDFKCIDNSAEDQSDNYENPYKTC